SDPKRVFLVGNTALDALDEGLKLLGDKKTDFESPYCVATIHRAGNTDNKDRLAEIVKGLSQLPMKCIFPIHPRTKKMIQEFGLTKFVDEERVKLVSPMGYLSFLNLLRNSELIVTDSGGVQEEAALLGKPTLTIRENTEWPETVWAGFNRLVTAESLSIKQEANLILELDLVGRKFLYEGNAGKRIVKTIVDAFNSEELQYSPSQQIERGYPMVALKTKQEGCVLMTFDEKGRFRHSGDGKHYLVEEYVRLSPGGITKT
ncbi:MAG: UDP-N-acetylglucosamine 2-epimerase, partial [Candidatus Thorarchaeota archaeon]